MGFLFAGATAKVEQGKVDAARIRQAGSNELEASKSSLARFSEALGNRRVLDAAGAQVNAGSENIAREIDSATYGRVGERVAAAERLGASIAGASAAGVAGSSVDAYNQTMRMQDSLNEDQEDRGLRSDTINAGRQSGQLMQDAVASMDHTVFNPNLDFTKYVDPHHPSTFETVSEIGLVAAATYFGGPQAGAGVASLFDAGNQAKNGDFSGAGRSIGTGVQGIFAGAKTYKNLSDQDHQGGRPWGSTIKIK